MRGDQTRPEDILRALDHIERYATGGRSGFDRDELLQAWMIRHLAVIGEAAARLSLPLRESHPEVPWSGIIGMRNVLVHGYFSIELDEVWGTVEVCAWIAGADRGDSAGAGAVGAAGRL